MSVGLHTKVSAALCQIAVTLSNLLPEVATKELIGNCSQKLTSNGVGEGEPNNRREGIIQEI